MTVVTPPRILLAGLTGAACCFVVPAHGAVNGNVALAVHFTSSTPGTSTGLHVDVRFGSPVGSEKKPPNLTGARIHLPNGTVIRTDAVPQCTAPTPAMQVAGTLACPADSRVGSGSLEADTGFGAPVDPLVGDDTVFNGDGELIEIVTPPGAPAPAAGVDRLSISGSSLTAHPPTTPGGPPDYTTNIRRITFTVPAQGSGSDAYITTPLHCPRSGYWVTKAKFYFTGGIKNAVTARTPCGS